MSENTQPGDAGALKQLYRDAIREHAAHPFGFRADIEVTHRHEEYNALCGDRIEVRLQLRDGQVERAAFDGQACAICMASASILCQEITGKPLTRLRQLRRELREALENEASQPVSEALRPLLGVRPYPSRIRCATLPWSAAEQAASES